jgi:hypothetical protein
VKNFRSLDFYRWVVTHSPSFFLYYFNDKAKIDPYLEMILGSCMFKTEWKDFDFLYFIGTMAIIVDYSRSEENIRENIDHFLVENKEDIYTHTLLKNPERLFQNMVHAHEMLQERHLSNPGEVFTQKAFYYDFGIFQSL